MITIQSCYAFKSLLGRATSKHQGLASSFRERRCCHAEGKDPPPRTFPKVMQSPDCLWRNPWSHSPGSCSAPTSSFYQVFYQPSTLPCPCAVLPQDSPPSHVPGACARPCPQLSAPPLALQSINNSPFLHSTSTGIT